MRTPHDDEFILLRLLRAIIGGNVVDLFKNTLPLFCVEIGELFVKKDFVNEEKIVHNIDIVGNRTWKNFFERVVGSLTTTIFGKLIVGCIARNINPK